MASSFPWIPFASFKGRGFVFVFFPQNSSQEGDGLAVKPAAANDIFLQVLLCSLPSRCFWAALSSWSGPQVLLPAGWADLSYSNR